MSQAVNVKNPRMAQSCGLPWFVDDTARGCYLPKGGDSRGAKLRLNSGLPCSPLERPVKKLLFATFIAFGLSQTAFAAESCTAQADVKKLSGAARTSFVKKCEAESPAASTCEETAAAKKLAGAAKTSFLKKCAADATGSSAAGSCETQAKEKKLAGAAKTSFVKKCVANE